MSSHQLVLGYTPKTLNRLGTAWAWRSAKKLLQRDLELMILAERLPAAERYEASAVLSFPTKRRRDEGNHRALLEKCLGDALVATRKLSDDTPDRYSFKAVLFADGHASTVILLEAS